MRDIHTPVESLTWEAACACPICVTSFVAETDDLRADKFKAPGTYWFDGSADASATWKFFVRCPAGCGAHVFIEADTVPALLQRQLLATAT
jgi:hypothetical protein